MLVLYSVTLQLKIKEGLLCLREGGMETIRDFM